jgi:hypothetical protein
LKPPRTQREKMGIRYERKVHLRLLEAWGFGSYFPSQWFVFGDGQKTYYFQPDGILLLSGPERIAIVEVKYQHTPDAYWQLEHFYLPLLRNFFKKAGRALVTVEVCKWYDPSVAFPRQVRLVENLGHLRQGDFNVHILNRPD